VHAKGVFDYCFGKTLFSCEVELRWGVLSVQNSLLGVGDIAGFLFGQSVAWALVAFLNCRTKQIGNPMNIQPINPIFHLSWATTDVLLLFLCSLFCFCLSYLIYTRSVSQAVRVAPTTLSDQASRP